MKFTSTVALMACMLAASGLRVEAKRRVGMDCPMFMVPRCKDGEVYGKKQWGNIPNCYQTICVKPRSLRSMGDPLFPAATECRQRCNEYRKKKMRYICLSDCIFKKKPKYIVCFKTVIVYFNMWNVKICI